MSAGSDRQRVAETLARTLTGIRRAEAPAHLCSVCLELLPVTGVSISLAGNGSERITLCASDRVAAGLAELQHSLGDGPCVQATALRAPVFATDLSGGPDTRRWPLFARQAEELGVGFLCSFPLGQGGLVAGTLDMYRPEPGALTDADVRTALQLADALTRALIAFDQGSPEDTLGSVTWWERAETTHEEFYQAVGMVMVQLGIGPEEAMARLRARAFAQGRTATEVAKDVINRVSDFGDDE